MPSADANLVFVSALPPACNVQQEVRNAMHLVQGFLFLLPSAWFKEAPAWGRRLLRFSIQRGIAFFPMTLIIEDNGKDITPGRPYVIGTACTTLARSCRCCSQTRS